MACARGRSSGAGLVGAGAGVEACPWRAHGPCRLIGEVLMLLACRSNWCVGPTRGMLKAWGDYARGAR